MIRLEDIKAGALIRGIEPREVVRIVTSEPIGENALTVCYKISDGTPDELTQRLDSRSKELKDMRHVASETPHIIGGALVIPAGLIAKLKGEPNWSADAEAHSRIEQKAMQAVIDHEKSLGYEVIDVSSNNCGWDITSIPPKIDGRLPETGHIEVKGRAKGQSTVTVTRNEVLYGLNQADKFILAIVIIDGETHEGPFYIRRPFTQEPDWAETSINLDLVELIKRGEIYD